MTIADKLLRMKEDLDSVYEAGKAAGGGGDDYRLIWWAVYQDNGLREWYGYAFYYIYWDDTTFDPEFDMRPTQASDMFGNCRITDLKGILEARGRVLDFSRCTNMLRTFHGCNVLTRLGVIDMSVAVDVRNMFMNCSSLVSIDELIFSETTGSQYNSTAMFQNCSALVEVRASGTIPFSIDLHWSTKLSKASIQSIYGALMMGSDASQYTITLSLTAVNKAFETSAGANDGSTSTEWQDLTTSTPWRTVLS